MSQTLPLPDDPQRRALLGRASHFIGWLLTQIAGGLAGPRSPKALREVLNLYLKPAEAAFRRALLLVIDLIPDAPAPMKSSQVTVHCHPGGSRDPDRPRARLFRLTEPLPRPRPQADRIPESQLPRISIIGVTPRPALKALPKRAPADPARLEANILRRVAALEAAFDNPLKAARRLKRLRARLRSARTTRPLLAFLAIPGFASKQIGAEGALILRELNDLVFDQETAPDTS